MRFQDKVAIVTGGASGIGLACVKELFKEGAKVVIADYSSEGEKIAKSFKSKNVIFIKTDVSKESRVVSLINQTVHKYGKLDIMIANAGIGDGSLCHLEPTEVWDKIVSVNLKGVFLCNKYALKKMVKQKSGSIVNVASILGLVGEPIAPTYSACKAGVVNLTRTNGAAYAKLGIRVNAVCPGYIYTPLIESVGEEGYKMLISKHPIGRLGEPEEVANCILFLASDDASFVTGASLAVDGAYTAV